MAIDFAELMKQYTPAPTLSGGMFGAGTAVKPLYSTEEAKWRAEQVGRATRGETVDPAWVKEQARKRAQGLVTDDLMFESMIPTATQPTAGIGTPGPAQIGPFSDALFGDDVPHPGWNADAQGNLVEAGPPGSPEFVRHPKDQADWVRRWAWFHGATDPESGTHGDMSMLDPKWTPINQYYNRENPEALRTLQQIASGQLTGYGMTELGKPWTREQAQEQLNRWGQGPRVTGTRTTGGNRITGGSYTPTPKPAPTAVGPSTFTNQLPVLEPFQHQPAPTGYTADKYSGLRGTMYEPGGGSARVSGRAGGQPYQPNTYYPPARSESTNPFYPGSSYYPPNLPYNSPMGQGDWPGQRKDYNGRTFVWNGHIWVFSPRG